MEIFWSVRGRPGRLVTGGAPVPDDADIRSARDAPLWRLRARCRRLPAPPRWSSSPSRAAADGPPRSPGPTSSPACFTSRHRRAPVAQGRLRRRGNGREYRGAKTPSGAERFTGGADVRRDGSGQGLSLRREYGGRPDGGQRLIGRHARRAAVRESGQRSRTRTSRRWLD